MVVYMLQNSLIVKQAKNAKEGIDMDKIVRDIIDDLIRDFKCVINKQYYCETDDLQEQGVNLEDIVQILWKYDDGFQYVAKQYINDLLESRLGPVQSQDYREAGLRPIHDKVNDEITWIPGGDAA